MELAGGSIEQSLGGLFRLVMQISFFVALAMLAISILDTLLQRYSQSLRLRMTDQQVRDESKSHAIHPQISRRRDQMRLAIRQRAEETRR
jgi:flagellar biosynthesis protein FlhB